MYCTQMEAEGLIADDWLMIVYCYDCYDLQILCVSILDSYRRFSGKSLAVMSHDQ